MQFLFNEGRGSVLQGEESSGLDGGDGCTTVRTYLITPHCTLKKN